MRLPRLALVPSALLFALAGCDVKKSPESAAVVTPEPPRKAEPSAVPPSPAPAAEPAASLTAEAPAPPASEAAPGPNASPECEERKAAIKARFVEAARCKTDAECEAMQPGCPFGCGLAINRSTDVSQLKRDIAAFKSECNDCMYRCRPPSGPPECRAGSCAFSAHAAK